MSKELIQAIRTNNQAGFEQLIKEGADVNYKDETPEYKHWTPLHHCIFKASGRPGKWVDTAGLLLAHGADWEAADWYGNTPALLAIKFYAFDIFNLLVQKGVNLHAVNKQEKNAFDIILDRYFTERRLDEDHIDDEDDEEQKEAILRGEGEALKRLFVRLETIIKNGYDVNYGKYSAAFVAVCEITDNNLPVKVLTWLFENGANVLEAIGEYNTPLFCEVVSRKLPLEIILAMVNKIGVNHVFESYNDLTLLVIAVEDNNLPLVQKLIELGADIDTQDGFALRHACFRGHFDVIKCLVEAGANIDVVDVNDNTPVSYAQQNGFQEIVDYLNLKSSGRS
jgi:ankyrin repeat protein